MDAVSECRRRELLGYDTLGGDDKKTRERHRPKLTREQRAEKYSKDAELIRQALEAVDDGSEESIRAKAFLQPMLEAHYAQLRKREVITDLPQDEARS